MWFRNYRYYNGRYTMTTKNYAERNGMWKGDNAGYSSLHSWIRKRKIKPELCEYCKKVPPKDLANISQEYHRDINDFKWLCRSCHMKEDNRILELHKRSHKREMINGLYKCNICNEFKEKKEFYEVNSNKDKVGSSCKKCKDKKSVDNNRLVRKNKRQINNDTKYKRIWKKGFYRKNGKWIKGYWSNIKMKEGGR